MGIIKGMIKIHQLLKESLTAYTQNFKNIFLMSLPILAIGLLGLYGDYGLEKEAGLAVIFLLAAVLFIGNLAVSLFFQPAIMRSVQKLDDTNVFDIKSAYDFQKKNIWNLIVLYFISFGYSIYKVWKLLVVLIALVLAGTYFLLEKNMTPSIILYVAATVLMIAIIILNAPRFVVYLNVFFSKGGKPKDAVLESIDLGERKKRDAWQIIFATIVFSIYVLLPIFVIAFFAGFAEGLATPDTGSFDPENPGILSIAAEFLSISVSALFLSPCLAIILAKGYNKIRDVEAEMPQAIESNPQ